MKQVVILAGGKGTRLRERLNGLPKPLIDVCGVPLLERQILLAKRYGFGEALVLVNHAADRIVDYCAQKQNWGIDVRCVDDGQPRGTAGATLAVFDSLDSEFLVMYGDTMLEVDLQRFQRFHHQFPGAAASLFLHPNDHPQDSDLVELDDEGRILGFHSYPHDPERYYPNLVNAALYCVNKKSLEPWRSEQGALDFAKDLFPTMLRAGLELRGFNSPEYIKDIGTPARLDKVCGDFRSGKIQRSSLSQQQSMIFLDRDGTLNKEVDHLKRPEEMVLLPGVPEAIKRLNKSDYRCCIVTNQPVIARGECTFDGLRQIHNKLETILGTHGAYIDRIYFCPHHPDGGFAGERADLKIVCDCRKPKTGMVDRAVEEFNIARDRSWFVGDTSIDMETARRAGLKSILVETGYAGLDYRAWSAPDVTVPDLAAAVSFILDRYPRLLSLCTTLSENIRAGDIIVVGGQSRSGKTTFASVLRDALSARGINSTVLSIDRWLKSEKNRGAGVIGRYDLDSLQRIVRDFESKQSPTMTLDLPGYQKLKREQIPSVARVRLAMTDVLLIEGTVALAVKTADSARTHRFHIDIDEETRKNRVLGEYRVRGLNPEQAATIYGDRLLDEFPFIDSLSKSASKVVPAAMQ